MDVPTAPPAPALPPLGASGSWLPALLAGLDLYLGFALWRKERALDAMFPQRTQWD